MFSCFDLCSLGGMRGGCAGIFLKRYFTFGIKCLTRGFGDEQQAAMSLL